MLKRFLLWTSLVYSPSLLAASIQIFRDEDGHTNWQHVANWSSGSLIIVLSIVVINLFFTRRQAHKANRELEVIRQGLEERVKERTATLDESNRLLKHSNEALETEVAQHILTTRRLQASEAYIQNILKSMPLMLIGLDQQGCVTQWNKRAEDISGISAAEALGKNLWDVYPTITVSYKQVLGVLEQNTPLTIKHSQRGRYHFDITIYPLQKQVEPGLVILLDDVTNRVMTENMLIQRDKMSSMGELASTMAYDINTPLQAILADLQSFKQQLAQGEIVAADRQQELARLNALLDDALEQGGHVGAIIRNLLAFARGRSEEKQLASIAAIMDHTINLAAEVLSVPSRLHFKDIAIERHYEDNLPAIPCYEQELQQVFLALFRHCCHALGAVENGLHAPRIRIEISQRYDALWIKIQHNGLGLSSEEQQYLFEPFFSHSSEQSDDDYDAGKRLSFPHFIITEHHRGEMAVTSDVNIGSTFHMQLQLK